MNHSRKALDITGQRFGHLLAISEHHTKNKHGQRQWVCRCDCGNTTVVLQHSLRQGNSTRCDDHPRNEYEVVGDTVLLNVSTQSRPYDKCVIDIDDLEKVLNHRNAAGSRMRWISHNSCEQGHDRWGVYVTATDRKTRLHRLIMGVTDRTMIVDHINGNTLDNRKANLKVITRSENNKNVRMRVTNTSGATGVSYNHHRDNYSANIQLNGKKFFLGTYNTLVEAKAAYEGAAKVMGFSERHGK